MTAFTSLGIKDADDLAAFLAVVVPPRALQYARTASDQMRVVIDSGAISNSYFSPYWGAANVSPIWYSSGAPNAMDGRESQREASNQTFQMTRNNWTF